MKYEYKASNSKKEREGIYICNRTMRTKEKLID